MLLADGKRARTSDGARDDKAWDDEVDVANVREQTARVVEQATESREEAI